MRSLIQEHVPLAPLTTFKIGGNARYFATVENLEDIQEILTFVRDNSLPLFILGGGSNILIADDGFSGLVLQLHMRNICTHEDDAAVLVTVDAGMSWDAFVEYAVTHQYAGLECLSGIPGTVGGAVVANIGAYGAECSDTFVRAEVIDVHDTHVTVRTIDKKDCDFSYHDSLFSKNSGRYLVVNATFAFARTRATRLAYHDSRFNLADIATEHGQEPSLAEVRAAVIKVRAEKGVLHSSYRSAGSFFHMPFVSRTQYEDIKERAHALDAEKELRLRPWAWEQPDGAVKIAPGFLLEYTPFQKGYTQGVVGISPKHTLSVITSDGASARDVVNLAQAMHDAVQDVFSISLEREVTYVGIVEK